MQVLLADLTREISKDTQMMFMFVNEKVASSEGIKDQVPPGKSKFTVDVESLSGPLLCSYIKSAGPCFKEARTMSNLATHLKTHFSARPFKCLKCDKDFKMKHHLLVHTSRHKSKFRCSTNDCKMAFRTLAVMKRHKRRHLDKETQLTCPYCAQRFKISANLKIHQRKHTGEKPFGCLVCDKHFISKGNYKRHVNIHHLVGHSKAE